MNDSIISLKSEQAQLENIIGLFYKNKDLSVLAGQEISYLEAIALRMPVIRDCEPISVLLAVKSVLKQNLTLDPNAGLIYIKTRNVNTGTIQQPLWKKVLEIELTANGKISFARMCGRILDIKRPQVKKAEGGKITHVKVEMLLPSTPHPRWESFDFDEDDFFRWRRASHKENRRGFDNAKPDKKSAMTVPDDNAHNYANENYFNFNGGIDPEFARAKSLKHALKKLGTNQNENNFNNLVINKIVDTIKDGEATEDEASNLINFEEVKI